MAAGTDFSSIGAGVDSSTAITAIVAMGVIVVGPGFAKWATKKVATFFG
ncbi:capsid protein [Luteibacter flocculans]|uniref:Capsid protein n=2 Tax=Luteibacter flocculans TaxID=2780091 RepID=A0ABY4T806_9GAMM|nr:capsid protein [Luteibacter flocculans]